MGSSNSISTRSLFASQNRALRCGESICSKSSFFENLSRTICIASELTVGDCVTVGDSVGDIDRSELTVGDGIGDIGGSEVSLFVATNNDTSMHIEIEKITRAFKNLLSLNH
mmetsp:Transcript_2226/g.4033  ORF Transcript_2226/g.4033 Transcript_2226/m.4033 type:complete len:112 (+) Transcript_2226:1089-1424(+)